MARQWRRPISTLSCRRHLVDPVEPHPPHESGHRAQFSAPHAGVKAVLLDRALLSAAPDGLRGIVFTSRVICQGRPAIEEMIFSLRRDWRFVDSEPLEMEPYRP
jgi:hypothetical protein